MSELSDVVTSEVSRRELRITFDVDRANTSQEIGFNLGVPLTRVSSAALKGLLPFDGYEGLREYYRKGVLLQNQGMAVVRESYLRENIDPKSTPARQNGFEYLAAEGEERVRKGYQPPNEVVSVGGWIFPAGALEIARTDLRGINKVTVAVVSNGQVVRELVYGVRNDGLMQYGRTFPEEPSLVGRAKASLSSLFGR